MDDMRMQEARRHGGIVVAIEDMHKQTSGQLRVIVFLAVFFGIKELIDPLLFG